ncbi:hypothetical protein HS1genome_1864 [Sulfodiicoccus acidiphilus]|uniref:Glycosyltransferase 2-like domain-containing protein n=1 Tax=Sulfodiicoccus acidiphilus TaxID=1670455 RepID=A0A348B5M3_9CREN|nr:glycosyltransferase [Sulfodiicoccus acidiphilus]BBD73475.1 hypothetical protein HS1genome_1864 [Sulfodiicoccus acidiphilus]GGT92869.1 hypothetical protein GCM10007116_08330 [Sulfodiicoccus acidiphilus]
MLILVVTHDPDENLLRRNVELMRLNEPEAKVMVIDNDSEKEPDVSGVELVRFPKNLGLGKAYNYAIREAHKSGEEWILLLDQDSLILQEFRPSVVARESAALRDPVLLSVIGPKGVATRRVPGTNFHESRFFVNSGTLVNVNYGVENPYMEQLFLRNR